MNQNTNTTVYQAEWINLFHLVRQRNNFERNIIQCMVATLELNSTGYVV